jgi:hypothetical protein
MPSYGGAHGPDGNKKSGDQGQGSRDKGGGQTGGDKGQKGSGFGGAKFGGPKGKASGMSTAAADHLVGMGRISTPSIPAGGVARGNYSTQDDAYNDFAKAVGKYGTRGFFDKALDFLGGGFYDPQEPMAGNPRSYAGGDFHSTSNPGSIVGGMLGMAAGPFGTLLGKAFGPAYTAAGLPEVWHGGLDQPDMRNGVFGNTDNPMGGSMADIGGGHTYASGSTPGGPSGYGGQFAGGGTGNAGQMGLPSGPMSQPQPRAPQAPAAGPTGIAAAGPMQMPGQWLGVPGPSQYGLMTPGYQWRG